MKITQLAAVALLTLSSAPASAAVGTSACPSQATQMFLEHVTDHHQRRPALGAPDVLADPAAWAGMHEALLRDMATKASGSCSGDSHHAHHGH